MLAKLEQFSKDGQALQEVSVGDDEESFRSGILVSAGQWTPLQLVRFMGKGIQDFIRVSNADSPDEFFDLRDVSGDSGMIIHASKPILVYEDGYDKDTLVRLLQLLQPLQYEFYGPGDVILDQDDLPRPFYYKLDRVGCHQAIHWSFVCRRLQRVGRVTIRETDHEYRDDPGDLEAIDGEPYWCPLDCLENEDRSIRQKLEKLYIQHCTAEDS